MRRYRLAAVFCLLALLAPAAAAFASPWIPSVACADGCCEAADCGGDSGEDCPSGCPECACSAPRIALPTPEPPLPPPPGASRVPGVDHDLPVTDSDPREILHVPRARLI